MAWADVVHHNLRMPAARKLGLDYDALHLPGGVINPDTLRTNPEAVAFVRSFFDSNRPVSSICHGPWMLIEANVVKGRTMTSWPSAGGDARRERNGEMSPGPSTGCVGSEVQA